MKKSYMAFAFGLALLGVTACGSNTNKTDADSAVPAATEREAKPLSDPESPVAIVDNRIIPVDDFGTVVDFYADWCPPCKKLKPIFEQFKTKYDGKLNFVSIDVDQYQNLASTYGITNIPTLVFISADGKEVGRMVGLHSPEEIEAQITTYFGAELD